MGLAKYLLEGGDLVGKWNKALWPNVCSVGRRANLLCAMATSSPTELSVAAVKVAPRDN